MIPFNIHRHLPWTRIIWTLLRGTSINWRNLLMCLQALSPDSSVPPLVRSAMALAQLTAFLPSFIAILLLCSCSLWSFGCRQFEPIEPYRPNIVWVSIDTLRADHLSTYGYHRETSPFLDELAREAALFENAYVQASHTLPSHMSMMTSRFPLAHGVTKESGPLVNGIPILAEILKEANYRSEGFYAIPWLASKFGFSRGFDNYESRGTGEKGGALSREAALGFLQEAIKNPEQPFFLFLHLRDVHCGPNLEDPQLPLYNSPPEFRDAFLPHPDVPVKHLPIDIWLSKVQLTDKERENVIAQYDGGILYADTVVHDVFEAMKTLGLYTETLIIVSSDHGESLGDHGDYSLHGSVWEEGLRVPLIVKLPDSHPERQRWRGVRLKHRVLSIDIAPFVLNTLGILLPDTFQGRDLFDPSDRDVIAHQDSHSALIRGNHKLKMTHNENYVELRLFDLANDPEEMAEIQDEYPDLMKSMARALETHLREHRDLFDKLSDSESAKVGLDAEQMEKLRALGYLGANAPLETTPDAGGDNVEALVLAADTLALPPNPRWQVFWDDGGDFREAASQVVTATIDDGGALSFDVAVPGNVLRLRIDGPPYSLLAMDLSVRLEGTGHPVTLSLVDATPRHQVRKVGQRTLEMGSQDSHIHVPVPASLRGGERLQVQVRGWVMTAPSPRLVDLLASPEAVPIIDVIERRGDSERSRWLRQARQWLRPTPAPSEVKGNPK